MKPLAVIEIIAITMFMLVTVGGLRRHSLVYVVVVVVILVGLVPSLSISVLLSHHGPMKQHRLDINGKPKQDDRRTSQQDETIYHKCPQETDTRETKQRTGKQNARNNEH